MGRGTIRTPRRLHSQSISSGKNNHYGCLHYCRLPHAPAPLSYHASGHFFFDNIFCLLSFFDTDAKIAICSLVRIVIVALAILSVYSGRKLFAPTVLRFVYRLPSSVVTPSMLSVPVSLPLFLSSYNNVSTHP